MSWQSSSPILPQSPSDERRRQELCWKRRDQVRKAEFLKQIEDEYNEVEAKFYSKLDGKDINYRVDEGAMDDKEFKKVKKISKKQAIKETIESDENAKEQVQVSKLRQ